MIDPDKTWYVYFLVFVNPDTGVWISEAWAQAEQDNTSRCTLLFTCPFKWIPKSASELREACDFYKLKYDMTSVTWYGDVCF